MLLLIDLFVLHRGTHVISMRDATWSTAGFVAAGAQLLERFEGIVHVFGALLLCSGVRMRSGIKSGRQAAAPPPCRRRRR